MADDGIITYEKIYDLLRLEKYKKEIQKLDQDFYGTFIRYLEEKTLILQSQENKDSVFASQSIIKTKRQLENIKTIIRELYEKRESKIIQFALFNSRSGGKLQEYDSLLGEELMLYNDLVLLLNNYRESILNNILQGKLPLIKEQSKSEDKKLKNVRFIHPVPKFVGDDMNVYGPFEHGDVSALPEKVSEVLIKNKRAEKI